MATIMPQSRLFKNAVQYVVEMKKESDKSLAELIDEASMRFNLSPNDAKCLEQTMAANEKE